jgi:hypothetical protein
MVTRANVSAEQWFPIGSGAPRDWWNNPGGQAFPDDDLARDRPAIEIRRS